jgi:hypothetical protein
MLVPKYWAEARIAERVGRRSVTVRRFGWSDTSVQEAEELAQRRAREAMDAILRGQPLKRIEPRMPYGGADGVPIREEIVSTHGEVVITRNSYGALCLNAPNVLFVDVDFYDRKTPRILTVAALGVALGMGIWCWWNMASVAVGVVVALFSFLGVNYALRRFYLTLSDRLQLPFRRAMERVRGFAQRHPSWRFRVYRTPAGLRIMAVHRTFDPHEPEVAECFKALGADPTYVRMCRLQRCFRARVSPKPWRMGIKEHIVPRHRTAWPIQPHYEPQRRAWIARYEEIATRYAACEFLEEIGHVFADKEVREVQKIHDFLCRVGYGLPLA